MPLYFSPVGNDQTFDANGDPLTGGQIETYIAESSTPLATFTDDTGSTLQSNPIILNSLGFPTLGAIWLTGGQSYKFVIKDSMGVTLRTIDNISGVNDASVSQSEWVVSGFTPTYINATSFSVPGDQTTVLQINRRLRTTNTSGFIYSTISNSVFAAGITTVTVANDSGVLDAGISTVEYALLSAVSPSVPSLPATYFSMSTARMLGRTTAGTGPVEELTATQVTTTFVNQGTEADAGKLELATTAEAAAGTDTARAVTAAGVEAHMNANELGWGQTWTSVTGSRSFGVNYTNSTGRPIQVIVSATNVTNTNFGFLAPVVAGVGLPASAAVQNASQAYVSFIVPNGAVYSVSNSGTGLSPVAWLELR